jgi:hypothetical protein
VGLTNANTIARNQSPDILLAHLHIMKRSASPEPAPVSMDMDEDVENNTNGKDDEAYFGGYVRPSTHRTMLQDTPRMMAYMNGECECDR